MRRNPSVRTRLASILASFGLLAGTALGQISFQDASGSLSFTRTGSGLAGVAWLDYDQDGDLDLFLPGGAGQSNALFRNDGGGSFVDDTAESGLAGGQGGLAVVAGDIDNDGYTDLFVGGEEGSGGSQTPTALYHNQRDGSFVDIAPTAGVPGPKTAFSSAFVDIDNDGFLDLFITGVGSLATSTQYKNELYLNNGDLTFTDISQSAGIDTSSGACAVACTDFDRDGWQDIVVAVCNDVSIRPTPIRLFRNHGDKTFTDVGPQAGLSKGGFWMCVAPGDIDGDGDIDFFASNIGTTAASRPHALYRNNGDGTYTDIALSSGVGNWEFGWGGTMADFDNDGDFDLFYTGSLGLLGFLGPGRGCPGRVFFNDGTGSFTQVAGAQPVNMASLQTSGVAQADFDGDGFADIVVATDTLSPTIQGDPVLLHNSGNGNNWLAVRLEGTTSNRGGVGAFVEAIAGGKRQVREVRAGSSVLASESPWPSFGLGTRQSADVRVTWPSGRCEVFVDVAARQTATLVEGTGVPAASQASFGKSCGTGTGVLAGAPAPGPIVGTSYTVSLTQVATNRSVSLLLGLSRSQWAGAPLPLALGGFGLQGCSLYVSPDVTLPLVNNSGTATLTLAIPNSASLLGTRFYSQATTGDPATGFALSNATQAKIGLQ